MAKFEFDCWQSWPSSAYFYCLGRVAAASQGGTLVMPGSSICFTAFAEFNQAGPCPAMYISCHDPVLFHLRCRIYGLDRVLHLKQANRMPCFP
eukprot:scaffold63523_cov20-Tisochrysis_lutea.AAC.7